jgi:hypothetical protein
MIKEPRITMTTEAGQTADQRQDDVAMRAREARIERLLGRPIPSDQQALVRAALADNDEVWAAHAITSVPDGTEPAFVFTPTRLSTTTAAAGDHE